MKKQLNHLRRFFAKTGAKKLNAATAREVIPASYDDDDGTNRLSGAFIVVLLLHVVALVGVFAFSRMKDPKTASAGPAQRDLPVSATAQTTDLSADESEVPDRTFAPISEPLPEPAKIVAAETPRPAPAPPRTIGGSHVVKPGESLSRIAVANSLRVADLMAANSLKSDEIHPGQELVIPSAAPKATVSAIRSPVKVADKPSLAKVTPSTYIVRKNDTLVKIARDHGVKYEDLIRLNDIKDPRKLQAGQSLRIPKKS
jgi:LysM repeat protein